MRNSSTLGLRTSLALAALSFLLCGIQVVEAQTIPSPYDFVDTRHELSATLGQSSDVRGALRLGPGGGTRLGLLYGIELTGPLALEGTLSSLSTDREVYGPAEEGGLDLLGTENSTVITVDGRIRFTVTGRRTWRSLAPFVLAGGGMAFDINRSSVLDADLGSNSQFTFGPSATAIVGIGTRWFLSDRFGLRVESTVHWWKLGTPRAFTAMESDLGPISESEWVGISSLVIGGSFHF